MPYATQLDIEALYDPAVLVRVADHDEDGVADDAVVTKGLDSASALIDGYISARYSLPLPTIPQFLRELCVDIAIYRMALTHGRRTEEMRQRYEDAILMLKDISTGKAGLGLPSDSNSDGEPDSGAGTTFKGRSFNAVRA